ncbi:MAG TPA: hypothetical protein PK431_01635 [Chitinophagales bacterium]|nr:hypothetical protein [Chitinophagales bacterium]
MKKLFYFIQLIDGVWSVPLGFFIFFFVGLLLSTAFGMAVGQYDLAFIQPLFLAGTVVVGATNMSTIGLYFTFRTIFKYLYGDFKNGSIHNQSKLDFHNLSNLQKLCVSLFLFVFFVAAILIVFLSLV